MDHTNQNTSTIPLDEIHNYFSGLQAQIVRELEELDGMSFLCDAWTRQPDTKADNPILTGSGKSQLIENGHVFERGGINFSHVQGDSMPASASAGRPQLAGRSFTALGVSLVLHPRNPYCPTAHMNVRFFIAHPKHNEAAIWWFGGGMDMTPYYGNIDDVCHFHRTCKDALSPFGQALYPRYKNWCDQYFYLKHRGEPRGVGGVFFDDLNEAEQGQDTFTQCFGITKAIGDAFTQAYLPIIEKRKNTPYSENERDFQAYRRGRYVEFNLVFDRGTLFGLQSGGRTESILMSMPPIVKWRYDWHPEKNTPEAELYETFLKPRDWLSEFC